MVRYIVAAIALSSFCTSIPALAESSTSVTSPDRRNRIDLEVQDGRLSYSVWRDGKEVLTRSPVGLFTSQGPLGGADIEIRGIDP